MKPDTPNTPNTSNTKPTCEQCLKKPLSDLICDKCAEWVVTQLIATHKLTPADLPTIVGFKPPVTSNNNPNNNTFRKSRPNKRNYLYHKD